MQIANSISFAVSMFAAGTIFIEPETEEEY